MSNDLDRLDFTLKNFRKHNPNIPVLVYDNGTISSEDIAKKYDCEYKKIENIWHKKTHCGTGSFDYRWFEYMFDFGLAKDDYTHILFLETDVYTTGPITKEPKYDMAGPLSFCGPKENVFFEYFNFKELGFSFNLNNGSRYITHTGCGGTIYTKEFFEKSKANLPLIKKAYEEMIPYCFMDLLITILGIISGCTVGDSEETSNLYGKYVYDEKRKDYKLIPVNWKVPMVHHVKFISENELLRTKIKSKFINPKIRSLIRNASIRVKKMVKND